MAGIKTPRWAKGIQRNHKGYPDAGYLPLAFDTETSRGYPYTIQFYDGHQETLLYLRPKQFLPVFVKYIRSYAQRHENPNVVMFGFYLAFDLPALLYPNHKRFADGTFSIKCQGCTLDVFYGKIPFARLRMPGGRVAWIIDAYAFVFTSLRNAARSWALPFKKLPYPKGLGKRVLRGPSFTRYAMRDAIVTWNLGRQILSFHKSYNVRLSVSIAQVAGRIFAHHYLQKPIPRAPLIVERASLLAYHGGKNGFYLTGPGWVRRCYEYDLRSAYPWAMMQMPSLSKGRWLQTSTVVKEGFYKIAGTIKDCRYPVLFSHDFQPLEGEVQGVWVTGYELHEALRSREIRLHSVEGWAWKPRSQDRPLRDFVRHFYALKARLPNGPQREQTKLILNSLYGKFIQLTPNGDATEKPGAYFHPPLAAWITGAVRARIHRLEHRAKALHTATDAIHTRRQLPTAHRIGSLELKQAGPAFILRNKVYFHFGRLGVKYAHHGIRMKPRKLWGLMMKGQKTYTVLHLLRPREALRLRTRPLQPVVRQMRVDVADYTVHPLPKGVPQLWRT